MGGKGDNPDRGSGGAGGAAAEAAAGVFLSPRVVDRGAFEDFAGQLRGLIERAAAERELLERAAARAEAWLERVRGEGAGLESRLSAAERSAEAIGRQVSQLEGAMASVVARVAEAAGAEDRLAKLAAETPRKIETEVRLVVQLAQDRVRAVHDEAAARALHLEHTAERRLSEAEAGLAEALGRVEERAGAARDALEQSVGALEERLAKLADQIIRFTGPGLRAISQVCDRAERIAGGGEGPAAGGLGALVERAERAAASAEAMAAKLESLTARGEAVAGATPARARRTRKPATPTA